MEKRKPKMRVFYYAGFYAAALILLVAATFKDLAIDNTLYNPANGFGIFMEKFAELPMFCIIPFAFTVMFYARTMKDKKLNIILGAGYAFAVFAGWVLCMFKLGDDWFGEDFSKVFLILIAVAFSALTLFLGGLIKRETMIRLRPLAIVGLLTFLVTAAGVEVIKRVWGRPRYRDMLNGVNGLTIDNFTPWYKIAGIKGCRSFPSGHTYAASETFLLLSVSDRIKEQRNKEPVFFAAAFVFTALTAFARLIAGAHFLSDVVIGAVIGFTVYIIIREFVQPRIFKFMDNTKLKI